MFVVDGLSYRYKVTLGKGSKIYYTTGGPPCRITIGSEPEYKEIYTNDYDRAYTIYTDWMIDYECLTRAIYEHTGQPDDPWLLNYHKGIQ